MTPSNRDTKEAQGAYSQPTKQILLVIKLVFMAVTVIFVIYFQVNRPKVVHSYSTKDPFDTSRKGVQYTCGCALPTHLQGVQKQSVASNSTLNACYQKGALETVRILMYPNFTGVDKLEEILNFSIGTSDSTESSCNSGESHSNFSISSSVREVEGLHQNIQAHDVYWRDRNFFKKFPDITSQLFPGGFRQPRIAQNVNYMNDTEKFTVFPASYEMVAFSFICNDCESCSLELVNEIFAKVAGDTPGKESCSLELVNEKFAKVVGDTPGKSWGDCVYWAQGNQCRNSSNPFYEAKCSMYPIAGIPLNFAIQRFLQEFLKMRGIDSNSIKPPWHWYSDHSRVTVSYDPNVLHMHLHSVTEGQVQLSFIELEKGSATWLQIRQSFPSVDTECADIPKVEVCNGNSLCNVYKNDESDGHVLRSLEMSNKTRCLEVLGENVTLDDAENVWEEFGIEEDNWSDLMCMDYSCEQKSPYLILQQRAPAMNHSTLNNFLDSKIFRHSWAKNAGVCTTTYSNVLKYNASNQTIFLETNCSSSPNEVDDFCWLTGRYRKLTDIPGDDWHYDTKLGPERSFVCYYVANQAFLIWLIVTFGILFGWLGTIELLFVWIHPPVAKLAKNMQGFRTLRRTSTDVGNVSSTSAEVVTSNSAEVVTSNSEELVTNKRKLHRRVSSRKLEPNSLVAEEVGLASPSTYTRLPEESTC